MSGYTDEYAFLEAPAVVISPHPCLAARPAPRDWAPALAAAPAPVAVAVHAREVAPAPSVQQPTERADEWGEKRQREHTPNADRPQRSRKRSAKFTEYVVIDDA